LIFRSRSRITFHFIRATLAQPPNDPRPNWLNKTLPSSPKYHSQINIPKPPPSPRHAATGEKFVERFGRVRHCGIFDGGWWLEKFTDVDGIIFAAQNG
jgi:hypothetical protein